MILRLQSIYKHKKCFYPSDDLGSNLIQYNLHQILFHLYDIFSYNSNP